MAINNTLTFILANLIVSAVSDILLNVLSRITFITMPQPIIALRTYFKHYNNALLTALYAGLTVVTILLLTMVVSKFVWGFATPLTIRQLVYFLALAVPFGYVADILIYKYKVFGKTLDPYYKAAGSGFYGAAAFTISIIVAYFIVYYIKNTIYTLEDLKPHL